MARRVGFDLHRYVQDGLPPLFGVSTTIRCTHAAYEAITGEAWEGRTLMTGVDLLDALKVAGFTYRTWDRRLVQPKTLRSLAKSVPMGTWYVYSSGHAMALVDGVLFDTEGRGFDGRRIIEMLEIIPMASNA